MYDEGVPFNLAAEANLEPLTKREAKLLFPGIRTWPSTGGDIGVGGDKGALWFVCDVSISGQILGYRWDAEKNEWVWTNQDNWSRQPAWHFDDGR